jgi:hypothetical protein
MPNPRTFALIGLASAVAAIAPHRAFKFEGPPRLDRPDVYGIAVRRDTIWFCAIAPRDTQHVTYGFARASRTWKTIPGDRPCGSAKRGVRTSHLDTMPLSLSGGLRVEVASSPRDSAGARQGRSALRFIDSLHSQSLELRPGVPPRRVARLVGQAGHVDEDTTAVTVGGFVANDSLAWIGLRGGFPEGEGALGGVHRIDRRSGAWQYIVDSTLAVHAVTGLAQTRDWLWVGTERPAEYGAYGQAGLRRLDLRTGGWRQFTSANSPVPDARITHVAADENAVALASEKGLAVIELRRTGSPREIERWNTRHYVPGFSGDSLVIRLGASTEALSDAAESPYIFAQAFGQRGHERDVFDQLKKVPLPITRAAIEGSFAGVASRSLANPAYAPILVTMLSSGAGPERTAAAAIRRLGDRTPADVRVATRAAYASVDTASRPTATDLERMQTLAAALRAFGDSTAIHQARRRLDRADSAIPPAIDPDLRLAIISTAANIVAEAHDPRGLTLVIANSSVEPALDMSLMNALAKYDSQRAWRELIDVVERRHAEMAGTIDPDFYWREVLSRATPGAFADAGTAKRMRDYIGLGLRSPREGSRLAAIGAIQRARVSGFGSSLVETLSDSTTAAQVAYTTLVSLYGRADAPAAGRPITPAAIAWWKRALNAKPVVVSRVRGEQAVREWTLRQSAAKRSQRR